MADMRESAGDLTGMSQISGVALLISELIPRSVIVVADGKGRWVGFMRAESNWEFTPIEPGARVEESPSWIMCGWLFRALTRKATAAGEAQP